MNGEKTIYVFDSWLDDNPVLIGRLYVSVNSNREIFAFECDTAWIRKNAEGESPGILLDPDLPLCRGRQYPQGGKTIFGMFSDSCPERWETASHEVLGSDSGRERCEEAESAA